jgi:adenylate cyclase
MLTLSAPLTAKEVSPMSLSKVIQTLVEHSESDRICKLLYWVYTGRWEGASEQLGSSVIGQILPALVKRTPSYDVLERRLYKAASVLNKPERYKQIATIIFKACAALYSCDAAPSSPQTDQFFTSITPEDSVEDALPMTTIAQPDRFELRRRVMQQVPPLKVKILLFSVLRHPFSFENIDWKALKAQSLDNWLAELTETFPAIDVLERKLFTQAAELKRLDQGAQIAEAVMQALRLQIP